MAKDLGTHPFAERTIHLVRSDTNNRIQKRHNAVYGNHRKQGQPPRELYPDGGAVLLDDYPTVCRELRSELKGTRILILVPAIGFDSISIVPFTNRMRSCMLVRPRPRPCTAVATSKPLPRSPTIR